MKYGAADCTPDAEIPQRQRQLAFADFDLQVRESSGGIESK
jgi:hypothetical protein